VRPPLRLYHFVALAALALVSAWGGAARAHTVGISQSDFALEGRADVRGELVFARGEGERLLGDHTEEAEVRALVDRGVDVRADGDVCPVRTARAGEVEGDGLRIDATFACDHAPRVLTVTLYLLAELPPSHRHLLRLSSGPLSSQVTLRGAERQASLQLADPPAAAPSVLAIVRLGIEHIARGWDHLLFLLALVLGERRPRSLVALVTAFTVAHSVALGLAAFGVVTFPARVVEPLIAASIAFVGFDNVRRSRARSVPRPAAAFAFGLVHGLGFASVLRDLALPRARLVPALLGFNVGVELGQLAFVLAAWPLVRWLHARPAIDARIARPLSLGIGIAGAVLCVTRIA
jgi:hydrogenase/urease accessory protein HupE